MSETQPVPIGDTTNRKMKSSVKFILAGAGLMLLTLFCIGHGLAQPDNRAAHVSTTPPDYAAAPEPMASRPAASIVRHEEQPVYAQAADGRQYLVCGACGAELQAPRTVVVMSPAGQPVQRPYSPQLAMPAAAVPYGYAQPTAYYDPVCGPQPAGYYPQAMPAAYYPPQYCPAPEPIVYAPAWYGEVGPRPQPGLGGLGGIRVNPIPYEGRQLPRRW